MLYSNLDGKYSTGARKQMPYGRILIIIIMIKIIQIIIIIIIQIIIIIIIMIKIIIIIIIQIFIGTKQNTWLPKRDNK